MSNRLWWLLFLLHFRFFPSISQQELPLCEILSQVLICIGYLLLWESSAVRSCSVRAFLWSTSSLRTIFEALDQPAVLPMTVLDIFPLSHLAVSFEKLESLVTAHTAIYLLPLNSRSSCRDSAYQKPIEVSRAFVGRKLFLGLRLWPEFHDQEGLFSALLLV